MKRILNGLVLLFSFMYLGSLEASHPGASIVYDTEESDEIKNFRTTFNAYKEGHLQLINEHKLQILDPRILWKTWEQMTDEERSGITYDRIPTREGLDKLHFAGCGQFNREMLKEMVAVIRSQLEQEQYNFIKRSYQVKEIAISEEALRHAASIQADNIPITVVDLREESHGFVKGSQVLSYRNGHFFYGRDKVEIALSEYYIGDAINEGQSFKEVVESEAKFIKHLKSSPTLELKRILEKKDGLITKYSDPIQIAIQEVSSEAKIAREIGIQHVKIPITDHHAMDPNEDVDHMLILRQITSNDVFKIFHCRGGVGRTTTGMVIGDMFENYNNPDLTFEDFVVRHWLIGGANLLKPLPLEHDEKAWKAEDAITRSAILFLSYMWIKETGHEAHTPFLLWLGEQMKSNHLAFNKDNLIENKNISIKQLRPLIRILVEKYYG